MLGQIRPGLRRWELPHPDWTPEEGADDGWAEVVASYATVAEGRLVLLDPLAPPPESAAAGPFWAVLDEEVARHGPPAILVTVYWHARSAAEILARYPGASTWADERAAAPVSERTPLTGTFRPGETLAGGIVPHDAGRGGESVFWLPSHRALVAGDVLLGAGPGEARICPVSWLGGGRTVDGVRTALQPLLGLPVELLLLTHGDAIGDGAHGALGRALAG